jgi:hypothetical protein
MGHPDANIRHQSQFLVAPNEDSLQLALLHLLRALPLTGRMQQLVRHIAAA